MRKAPSLRNNNGALQVRVRLDGKDHFINRLGSWDDPVAQARARAISAEIWSDYQQGTLDWTLSRYKPLVEGKDPELLKALEELMLRKRQGRVTHAYRVVKRYGKPLRTKSEVVAFLSSPPSLLLSPRGRPCRSSALLPFDLDGFRRVSSRQQVTSRRHDQDLPHPIDSRRPEEAGADGQAPQAA